MFKLITFNYKKTFLLLLFVAFSSITTNAQIITQTVRGHVSDKITAQPLPGVHVVIMNANPQKIAISDADGNFELIEVPVGRYNIKASYMGYNPLILPEIEVGSGKEVVLLIPLEESITSLEGIEVLAKTFKDEAQNPMAFVSSRSFTVEEANRYAGGFDDPARMAAVFPGVGGSGGAANNAMAIRGNSPKGVLWRVEGVEVPNPNHFSGASVAGGGMVSVLSAQVLDNSDFYTGAFPAEYGNALSGVFDMRFRKGNNKKREFGFQVGVLGIDAFAEGPFVKNKKSSYLFNYRYSTLGLIKNLNPAMVTIPEYQDLSFKFNFPTKKSGEFSLWGFGAKDVIEANTSFEPQNWTYVAEWQPAGLKQNMGASGLSHKFNIGKLTSINTSLVATGNKNNLAIYKFSQTGILNDSLVQNYKNLRFTVSSYIHHKFSARHINRTGIMLNRDQYNMRLQLTPTTAQKWSDLVNEADGAFINQFYTQSKFSLTSKLFFNAGFHSQWFTLNNLVTLEPRLGLSWEFLPSNALSLGYGNHSRVEPLPLLFARKEDELPNTKLKLTRANHFVVGYDKKLHTDQRLKIEVYYQHLYNVPMIENTTYSVANFSQEYAFNEALTNNGLARNYGLEFTYERFLRKGFYYLLTSSLFDSKYSNDGGNTWHNTRFNYGYIANGLMGKEFTPYRNKNKIVGLNLRITAQGNERNSPPNQEASVAGQRVIFDETRPYSERGPNTIFVDFSVTQKNNKPNYSSTWGLQVKNLLAAEGEFGYNYNYVDQKVELRAVKIIIPVLFYKIQF